jgi:hypothetical protein
VLTRPCLVPRPPWQCFGMPPCRKAAPLSPSSSSPMLTPDEPLSRTPKAAVLTQAQKMSRLEKLKQKKIDEQLEIQVGCPQPLCLSAGFPHRTRTVASRLRAMRLRATPGGPSNGLTLPHWHRSSHPKLSSNGARGTGGGGCHSTRRYRRFWRATAAGRRRRSNATRRWCGARTSGRGGGWP